MVSNHFLCSSLLGGFNSDIQLHLGGGYSNIFGIFIPNLAEDSHFDYSIFQMGWFNHQLEWCDKFLFPSQLGCMFWGWAVRILLNDEHSWAAWNIHLDPTKWSEQRVVTRWGVVEHQPGLGDVFVTDCTHAKSPFMVITTIFFCQNMFWRCFSKIKVFDVTRCPWKTLTRYLDV